MPNIFLPWIRHNQPSALKDVFRAYGVRFGMAAEAYMFDSAGKPTKAYYAVIKELRLM